MERIKFDVIFYVLRSSLTGNFCIIDGNLISSFHYIPALYLLVALCCFVTRRRENSKTGEGKLCIREHSNIQNPYSFSVPLPTADFLRFYTRHYHRCLFVIGTHYVAVQLNQYI
jgi:hypothetical protein